MENDKSSSSIDSSPSSDPSGDRAAPKQQPGQRTAEFPKWGKFALLAGVIVLGSIGYFTGGFSKRSLTPQLTAHEADPEELAKRKKVPDISLTDADGKQKKLSDYRGNVVILSFWASWCAPCLIELPTFAEIEKRFAPHGLKIVAVNVDEGDDGKTFAKDFWNKKGFSFPSFFDRQKTLAEQFEVDMLPATFVIDRQGRIAFSGFGANDWSTPATMEVLEGVLSEISTP